MKDVITKYYVLKYFRGGKEEYTEVDTTDPMSIEHEDDCLWFTFDKRNYVIDENGELEEINFDGHPYPYIFYGDRINANSGKYIVTGMDEVFEVDDNAMTHREMLETQEALRLLKLLK